jgi:hypothetical protein
MRKILVIIIAILSISIIVIARQEERKASDSEIPELREMHHFIRPMWHKGYPEKDIKLLQSLYPDLYGHFEKLQSASFPEEWLDRKMHWQQGLDKMENSLKTYKSAMDSNNDEALLQAARELHDNFESLMMIVNPPIPEIDDFHKTLYHVYHDYLPNQDWEKIRSAMNEFEQKMENIEKVVLPKWMADQEEQFNMARKNLKQAVKELSLLKDSEDNTQLEKAIKKVHEAYVNLAGACE